MNAGLSRARSAAELVASGAVTPEELFRAASILERLNDRGVAKELGLEEMCEVLGYVGGNRPPSRLMHDGGS